MPKPPMMFISYAHEDREEAGDPKKQLEELYGITSFVAHHEIEVSSFWRKEIESALRNCVAVAVLLSETFKHSTWANQELGFSFHAWQ